MFLQVRIRRCLNLLSLLLLPSVLLTACFPLVGGQSGRNQTTTVLSQLEVTAAPTQTATSAPTAVPTTPVPPPPGIWLPPYLPQALRESLKLPSGFQLAKQEAGAGLRMDLLPGDESNSIPWVYALVAPFPTITDEVTLQDLQSAWKGGPVSGFQISALLVDEFTHTLLEKVWGPAADLVRTLPDEDLLDVAWREKTVWAILPFEQIEPRWKVIAIDGQSPIQKAFDPSQYPLTFHFGLQGDSNLLASLASDSPLAAGNRQADRLTTVVVTGVTALVRGTASLMELRGMDYPAQDIGPWLRDADILHISNEVAFAKNCPAPYPWEGLAFCSQTEYIQLLEDIGTDVVDLAGDHFQDWGKDAMLYTLDLYKERGWKYYGGGANIEEAQSPALFEHNGNKIAFLGCNAKPPGYASAAPDYPGAVHCDLDELTAKVKEVRQQGYLPIVTFQHLEYYSYNAHPILQADFKRVADAGAIIVSGSQAHQPHAMTFQPEPDQTNVFLHYGLGNLFFDQMDEGYPTRQAFIDRHVFYNGHYINTELLTILFVDYARARPMTAEERQDLLTTVFKASGW